MEYSWGQNVWELGLGATGATLCARFPSFPRWVWTNADYVWETGIFSAWQLPNMADEAYVNFTGFGNPRMGFPYGIPAEPNVPV